MSDLAFTNLLGVVAIAFVMPLVASSIPFVRIPPVVLELCAGIALGPAGLGLIEVDDPVAVLALVGLAMLLFLAGLELDPQALRGPLLRRAAIGFGVSLAVAFVVGLGLHAAGTVRSPLFIAIVLSATSLGVVVPVLKDAGLAAAPVGQLVVLGASIADVATIVLLSLLFSEHATSVGAQAVLIGGLVLLAAAFVALAGGVHRLPRLTALLARLQDTTAQIRVRGAMLLLIAFVAVAQQLGLEVILGAFIAGALLAVVDPDQEMTHPAFRTKLEAIGFGFVIPVFFVTSGLRFDLTALTSDASTIARVPLFLLALLAARGLPALVYRGAIDGRSQVAAGLLQATSLPFLVASAAIGQELGLLSTANGAALVAAGLLSVLIFPSVALALLTAGGGPSRAAGMTAPPGRAEHPTREHLAQ